MKPFKGPAKQRGFVGALLQGASALGGLFGARNDVNAAREDIRNLPGMQGPPSLSGNFGTSEGGNFQLNPELQGLQTGVAGGAQNMLSGGQFNDPRFQQAFQNNDIAGAFQSQQGLLNQQLGNNVFGGGQQAFNTSTGLAQGFANQVAGGPQDFSGGLQQGLFNQGFQNQLAAGDQRALFDQSLAQQRAAFAPEAARQQQSVEQSLFSKGMLGAGSTNTGDAFRGLFEAQGAQDFAFQDRANDLAFQQQNFLGNLGSQQLGQGQNFLGQNLGQFNQNVQNFQGLQGLAQGMEGQQFGQNLQALGHNQRAGQQRLADSLGLFQQGSDLFNQSFGLGLQGAGAGLDFGRFGLEGAGMPFNLQANLLEGSSGSAQALNQAGQNSASATGNLFSGVGSALGKIFG